MSNLYNLEPQPTAKVILQTTAGELSLELFAKQTPLASRSFLQHCLDGYYNGTIFHRLVPGFVLQGGDPTGTGAGGESGLDGGAAFADEFHSRLKFNRRGLLAMANEGPDSNGSQFFLTLGATPELQGRNTLFGRIEGDTIYNLMKMAEAEVAEGSDRPLYPAKITGADVLVNPFEGMVARAREAPRTRDEGRPKEIKKRKKQAGKNVLSFGVDDGEEEAAPVLKKPKANPKLVSVEGAEDGANAKAPIKAPSAKEAAVDRTARRESPPRSRNTEADNAVPSKITSQKLAVTATRSPSTSPEAEAPKRESALERTNAEIAALKASMKRRVDAAAPERAIPKNALDAMIPATSTRGRKRGKVSDEKGAFDMFKAFKQRLEGLPGDTQSAGLGPTVGTEGKNTNGGASAEDAGQADEEAELCDLHFIANCQSCKAWDDQGVDGEAEVDADDDTTWMAHTLTFAKDTLGKDLEWKRKMEEIEVIDPREKAKSLKDDRRKGRDKGKSQR